MSVIRDNMAPLMFGGMILFMLIGFPAAFSLAATGLAFGFLGIELGLIRPDFLGNLTFQLYGVMSNDLLLAIPKTQPEYLTARRLLKILHYFLPVGEDVLDEIPPSSILREFIGECSFYDRH